MGDNMQKKYLECAEIINKRGIAGELKANCLCDGIEALSKVKTLYTSIWDFSIINIVNGKTPAHKNNILPYPLPKGSKKEIQSPAEPIAAPKIKRILPTLICNKFIALFKRI